MYLKVEIIPKGLLTGSYLPQQNVSDFCRQIGLPSAEYIHLFSKIEFTFDRESYLTGYRNFTPGDRAIIHFLNKG